MKRFVAILLGVLLMTTLVTSAYAITGADDACDDVEFCETDVATFILDDARKICGVLRPNEELKKVGFQSPSNGVPRGLEDGKAIRRRVFARVNLDDDFRISKGGKNLEVTVTLIDYDLVEEIVGDVTVQNIIDATIYSPDICSCKPHAAHIFLNVNTGRVKVGWVTFKCGKILDLYAGHFFDDCSMQLGFTAKAVEVKEECIEPCVPCIPCTPCVPCVPCVPCIPEVTVTTTTTTEVVTTTTTTTTIGSGCKK